MNNTIQKDTNSIEGGLSLETKNSNSARSQYSQPSSKLDFLRLENVEQSLLTTLSARTIADSQKLISDLDSAAMADKLGLNVADWSGGQRSVLGIAARFKAYDSIEENFLIRHADKNPFCIHLGAGLDARHLRMGRNYHKGKWLDIDLPNVIQLKNRVLSSDITNYYSRGQDVTEAEFAWLDELDRYGLKDGDPVMITAEGLLMYLNPESVEKFFKRTADRFANRNEVHVVFDTFHLPIVSLLQRVIWLIPQSIKNAAPFCWAIKNPETILEYDNRYEIISSGSIGLGKAFPRVGKSLDAVYEKMMKYHLYSLVEIKISL